MGNSVFAEAEFWLLIAFSFVLPAGLYGALIIKRAISRWTVLTLGLSLLMVSAVDIYLLRILAAAAKSSPSLMDDRIFDSEVTVALYLLPTLFAGTGINIVSHVLIRHLGEAESRFDREHPRC